MNLSHEDTFADLKKRWRTALFFENNAHAVELLKKLFDTQGAIESMTVLVNGTNLQIKVWYELIRIVYGQTVHYEEIASQIGSRKAVRAIANAVGANPVSYFIPCHRVLRKSGKLGGYRWGIEIKKMMLVEEGYKGLL